MLILKEYKTQQENHMSDINNGSEKIISISKENAQIYYNELLKNYHYDTRYLYIKVPCLKSIMENEILREITGINDFNIHFEQKGQWKWLKDRMEIRNKNGELKNGFIPQELFSRIETLFKERNAAEHKKNISNATYKYHLETVTKIINLFSGIAIPKEILDIDENKKDAAFENNFDGFFINYQKPATKTTNKKNRKPTGYFFVNTGISDDPARNWQYNKKFKFVSAGNDKMYITRIRKLVPGDKIFSYIAGNIKGYVGYGIVSKRAVRVRNYIVNDQRMLDDPVFPSSHKWKQEKNEDIDEWIVEVDWVKTVNENNAVRLDGPNTAFISNVCNIYEDQKDLLDSLKERFGIND